MRKALVVLFFVLLLGLPRPAQARMYFAAEVGNMNNGADEDAGELKLEGRGAGYMLGFRLAGFAIELGYHTGEIDGTNATSMGSYEMTAQYIALRAWFTRFFSLKFGPAQISKDFVYTVLSGPTTLTVDDTYNGIIGSIGLNFPIPISRFEFYMDFNLWRFTSKNADGTDNTDGLNEYTAGIRFNF